VGLGACYSCGERRHKSATPTRAARALLTVKGRGLPARGKGKPATKTKSKRRSSGPRTGGEA